METLDNDCRYVAFKYLKDLIVELNLSLSYLENEIWNPYTSVNVLSIIWVVVVPQAIQCGWHFKALSGTGKLDSNLANKLSHFLLCRYSYIMYYASNQVIYIKTDFIPFCQLPSHTYLRIG